MEDGTQLENGQKTPKIQTVFFVYSELQPYNTYVNAYESVSQGAKTTKKHLECAAKR